jgi:hypothetical protein
VKQEHQVGEVKRADPMLRANSSSVLRSRLVGAGYAQGGRSGAQRRPPACAGLSKAHISAHTTKNGTITAYRNASLLQVRLRADGIQGRNRRESAPRGEITEFSAASRRRMLEVMAKVQQAAVPFFVTLTYPDEFPLYREDYKRHLETFFDRLQRRWPGAAVIWKLEFKERKSGQNKGKIAPHYHLFVYGVPWAFDFKDENGASFQLRHERNGDDECGEFEVRAEDGGCSRKWEGRVFDWEKQVGEEKYKGLLEHNAGMLGLDTFRDWVARHWYDVVGSKSFSHFRAGTRVERLRTTKGAFAYAAKRYVAKKEEMADLKHKPGRFWGVVGRKNLPFGKREDRDVTAKEAVQIRRTMRRYRWANTPPEKRKFLRKSQLWSQEFTAKLFCNVEFWIERLVKLNAPQPELERPVAVGKSLLPLSRPSD